VALLDRAVRLDGLAPQPRAAARNRQVLTLLRQGKPALALAQAELALVDARGRQAEFETLRLLAIAQAATGKKADSEKTLAELETRGKVLPSDRENRRVQWARGQVALIRGDTNAALTGLMAAVKMLPPQGPPSGPPSSHAGLLFDAASACIKAGRDADAAPLLERLQSGYERGFDMDPYARSFYLLGQLYERRGEAVRAREQYARFLDLWRDGDLERAWIADAQKKLAR